MTYRNLLALSVGTFVFPVTCAALNTCSFLLERSWIAAIAASLQTILATIMLHQIRSAARFHKADMELTRHLQMMIQMTDGALLNYTAFEHHRDQAEARFEGDGKRTQMTPAIPDLIFKRTSKGEALVHLVKLFMRLDKTRKPSARNAIIAEILAANEKFQLEQKEDGILLIERAFSA